MDRDAVLEAFDEQIRRHPQPEAADGRIERGDGVVRTVSGTSGWNGVTWSDLDEDRADAAIAAQVSRFAGLSRAVGVEALLLRRAARTCPSGCSRRASRASRPRRCSSPRSRRWRSTWRRRPASSCAGRASEEDVEALVRVHDEVFGEDHSALGDILLAQLARGTAAAVIAVAGGTPVSAGRVEFNLGTDFASLWGGGTLAAWRGRGVFRALVAHRAAMAAERGLPLPPGRRVQRQPADPRAARLRRAGHHHPVHAPGLTVS